jgi:hypothetical protein
MLICYITESRGKLRVGVFACIEFVENDFVH